MSAPPIIRDQIRETALARGRDYVRTAAAADYIGFAAQTLRNWRVKGHGPRYQKVSGDVRYYLSDLDSWLDAQFVDCADSSALVP